MNRRALVGAAAGIALMLALGGTAVAASEAELNADADQTIELLKQSEPVTQEMIDAAKGILIFPKIVKGGLLVGAASGKGVLRINGKTEGFYQSTAVSYGLQAGVSKFGYLMFLMDDESLKYVKETHGWEVGVGPNITIADEGFARKLSSTTAHSGIYVFFVGQKGFLSGAGIEGTKISRIAE